MPLTIGIDVGGTKIAAGVVDADGTILARRRIETRSSSEESVVVGITKVALELCGAAAGVTAVGVGAAGLVDAERGIIRSAPNIAWADVHLRAMLIDRLGIPVVVDNDANAAAWGEARFGAGVGCADLIMVTVGTGIGGGLILNGSLYRGATGVGAEVGHMIIDGEGPPCACGANGCFESLASGTALGRRAREAGHADATGESVGAAALAGDDWARALVAETGTWLGIGLAGLVNLLDPEQIVVGGGAGIGLGELLLEPAREAMRARIVGRQWRSAPPVVPALLGEDAGIVGAAALAAAG